MKTRGCLFLLVLLIGLLAPAFSAAAVPRTINYQGYMKDSGGTPLNGTASIKFSLYSSSSGGSELWTETHSSVAVSNGLYSVILGSVDPVVNPLSLPFDVPYYLGISAGLDPEMTPRQALTSTPFAIRAAVSDSVPSGMVTTDKIAAGAVTPEKLANVCPQGDFLVKTPSGWGCFSTSCIPSTEVCDGRDNDCNGQIDEGFPNLGQPCVVGSGTCQSTGIFRCTLNGLATECSATAKTPGVEICNGLDDDCDTQIDNGLAGALCPKQAGVCAGSRQICMGIAGWMTCSDSVYKTFNPVFETVEMSCDGLDNDCDGSVDNSLPAHPCASQIGVCAGSIAACGGAAGWLGCGAAQYGSNYQALETVCDGLDNDCDGVPDEGWLNSGKYDQNTACGNCYTDCTTIYAKPNAYGTCNAAGIPVCVMNCNAGYYDLNGIPGDGCEFQLDAAAVYVSGSDGTDDASCGSGPTATGGGRHPCVTITYGISRAVSTGRSRVTVAAGSYNENIQLTGGISLYGGYHPVTWERNISANRTAIYGNNTGGGHNKAVRAVAITSATVFDGFTVYGQSASSGSVNSYAIYVLNSNSNLAITNNSIIAGSGGRGSLGSSGSYGTSGTSGAIGSNWLDTGTKTCSGRTGAGGLGGINTCGGSVNGGAGASTACPGACTATSAGVTGNSVAGGGAGGTAGAGAYNWESNAGCSTVSTCGYSNTGGNGGNGTDGTNGVFGAGCSSNSGTVTANEWTGSSGGVGASGTPGGGGGGGGAGGGLDDNDGCSYNDMLGGAGGGGGAGGCNGAGGAGGTAGGGSFGLFVYFNPASASFPVISGNTITAAAGGDGGGAGFGGVGGSGGGGANGGSVGGTYSWALGIGGRGGQGGDGGHGGGGGGGCGGVAYGIYLSGATGTPNYKASNTFAGTPTGGIGGAGGPSLGNSGTAGSNGAAGATNF